MPVITPNTVYESSTQSMRQVCRLRIELAPIYTLVMTGSKDYGVDNSPYTVLMANRQNATQTLLNLYCAIDVG